MSEDNADNHQDDEEDEIISKSQIKREALAVTEMGEALLKLSEAQLSVLPYPAILDALLVGKRITKGNAIKRQLGYIGRLLRAHDLAPVQQLLDRYDASSRTHSTHFHLIEGWRDRLIKQDKKVVEEIRLRLPNVDIQRLRQLSRNAVNEKQKFAKDPNSQKSPIQFKKLFQFLKDEADVLLE